MPHLNCNWSFNFLICYMYLYVLSYDAAVHFLLLVYLSMLSVAQIKCQVTSWSVNRETERIWKGAVVNRFTVVVRFTWVTEKTNQQTTSVNPYPTAFPYGNSMVLHFYQQQESSTTKTVHRVINKGLKTYV